MHVPGAEKRTSAKLISTGCLLLDTGVSLQTAGVVEVNSALAWAGEANSMLPLLPTVSLARTFQVTFGVRPITTLKECCVSNGPASRVSDCARSVHTPTVMAWTSALTDRDGGVSGSVHTLGVSEVTDTNYP